MKHQMYVSLLPKGFPSETPVQIAVDGVEHGEAIISAFGLHTLDDASIFVHHPDIENGASPYQEICGMHDLRERLAVPIPVTVHWNLYKPSGKWAYGGKATFVAPKYTGTQALLQLVADNQKEVAPSIIINRHYTAVIMETDQCMDDPAYQGFLHRLIPANDSGEV